MVTEYENSTGTLTMLFSRLLWQSTTVEMNALQMRPGEQWAMGFLLELGYATNIRTFEDYVDGWTRKIYPYLDNDASWCPKLCIDLSYPPLEF